MPACRSRVSDPPGSNLIVVAVRNKETAGLKLFVVWPQRKQASVVIADRSAHRIVVDMVISTRLIVVVAGVTAVMYLDTPFPLS